MRDGIREFDDLDVWKRSHALTLKIYNLIKRFPKEERFGLSEQVRRSISSIGANIAEGFSRYHTNDKIKFYYNARGSISESKNHIFLARDLGYLDATISALFIGELDMIKKQLNAMINSLRSHATHF